MLQSEKVHFTQEKETMLITLYARAMQSRSSLPILPDPWAEEAIIRGAGAVFSWGLDNPNHIKQLEPRLQLVAEHKVSDLPTFSRLPWRLRALVRTLGLIPALRIMRCLLYRF